MNQPKKTEQSLTLRNIDLKKPLNEGGGKSQKEVPINEAVSIMASIIRQKRSATRKDVDEWRQAWAKAEDPVNPHRYKLIQIYKDTFIDGHLQSAIGNRIMRITNKKFKIVDRATQKEDPVKTELFRTKWFKDFVWHAMESIFWGFKLVEFYSLDPEGKFKKIRTIPDEHLLPNRNQFLYRPSDTKGPSYLDSPWTEWHLPIGDSEDLGLLLPLSLLAIYKKNTWASWSEFEEIFGIPIRIAKVASQDPKVKAEVQQWMEEMGTASYGIFPTGTELDIKAGAQTDAFQVFEVKRKAINEEMSKLVNGQTMTTDNGSSRSQSEVHERTEGQITLDDLSDISYLINDELLPFAVLHGYPFSATDQFVWDEQEQLSIMDKWKIHSGILQYFDVDPAFIEETYGIPVLGKRAGTPPDDQPAPDKKTAKMAERNFI